MKSIKLPFGLNENNRLVHIVEVERGKKCNCICPACKSLLIACMGEKNRAHFKHAVINECEGGFESSIHLAAKQLILEKKIITLPKYDYNVSEIDSKGKKHTVQETIKEKIVDFHSVQEEVALHGIRADLLAKKEDRLLIIEIFYRHKVDDQKLEKIIKSNISAIEINLSDLTPEDVNVKNWEAFWIYLNDSQQINWLHNAKSYTTYCKLEKQLAKTIQAQEEKYKQEEIKKQRKEQIEQEQLLQALEEIKILSNKESIAHFKQIAEMHPVWKYNAPYLPFSWHQLPDFVNADIPNGDWIFGCDKRIWQTAFYKSFIWKNSKPFSVKNVDNWLQNTVGCKVHQSVKIVGIYGKRYPQLIPTNSPSSWKTLKTYFNYLENLGILEFSGNGWFQIIDKKPKRNLVSNEKIRFLHM